MSTIRYTLTLLVLLFLLPTHVNGNDIEALRQAIWDEDLAKVKKIISKNPELVNARYLDATALSIAAGKPRDFIKKPEQTFEIVKYLIAQGADYDSINDQKRTPLFRAISANHTEAIICLVNLSNRNINLREEYESNPWATASRSQSHRIIGNNPLEKAMWKCGLNIIQCLIKKGAQAREDKIYHALDAADKLTDIKISDSKSDSELGENAQFILQFLLQKKDYLANPLSSSPTLLPMILMHLVSLRTFKDKDFEWVVSQYYQASKIETLKTIMQGECDEGMRSQMLDSLTTALLSCEIRFKKLHDLNFIFPSKKRAYNQISIE